jgi:hypothetical protein
MKNNFKYIGVIKIDGLLKCIINKKYKPKSSHLISDIQYNLISEWQKNHVIIDFNSEYDLIKSEIFSIEKHFKSGIKISYEQAIEQGIKVNCIDIKDTDEYKNTNIKAFYKFPYNPLEKPKKFFKKDINKFHILDNLSNRIGKDYDCNNFFQFCSLYNHNAIMELVFKAMDIYNINTHKNKKTPKNATRRIKKPKRT